MSKGTKNNVNPHTFSQNQTLSQGLHSHVYKITKKKKHIFK